MPLADLADLERRLAKRGFRRDDVFLHDCPDCGEHAVLRFILLRGRIGGRDIAYCQACARSRSWRSGAGHTERVEDPEFDLERFLGR
ncbi:MAG: hypothetical protein R2939_16235 [Kofleriaceae bacterium]